MPGLQKSVAHFNDDRAVSRGVKSAKVKAAATTNINVVKATPGVLYSILLTSNKAGAAFIKLYDKATAPVIATDAALLKGTFRVGGTTIGDGPLVVAPPHGIEFAAGIAYALTGAIGETDETALVADDVTGVIGYL